jgi:hypothetical protein
MPRMAATAPEFSPEDPPPRLRLAGVMLVASLLAWSWLATRSYGGVAHDGVFYAMLALAHAHPAALGHDMFVSHGSQAGWTLFPSIYAVAIRQLGLEQAALLVTLGSNALAVLAAWFLAGRLLVGAPRLVAVLLLLLVPGLYGAESIFGYLEPFATPRTLAEAAVLCAIALVARHSPSPRALAGAGGCIAAGFAVHPLIALPGLLLCLLLVRPRALEGAWPTVLALALAAAAPVLLAATGLLAVMDDDWLRIVRDVAPYLFLSEWSLLDWQRLAVPACSLAAAWTVLPGDSMARRLAGAGLLLAGLALIVAWVGSETMAVALVIQGQAWRWLWLCKALAVLLLVPCLATAWRAGGTARVGAVLLVGAWLGSEDALGMPAALLALLMIVLGRGGTAGRRLPVAAAWLLAAALLVPLLRLSSLLDEAALAALAIACAWLASRRAIAPRALACGIAALLLGREAAAELRQPHPQTSDLSAARAAGFESWRQRIPESSTVLYPGEDQTLWFLLWRSSYISPGQTIGATFSRAAAIEMRRRAFEIADLLPPEATLVRNAERRAPLPLTAALRGQLCALPDVDFVVGNQPLPGPRLLHPGLHPEPNMYLYACRGTPRAASSPP